MGVRVRLDEGGMADALEDGSLRGGLELEPLLPVVLLRQRGEGKVPFGVVLVEDAVHDSIRL